MYEEMTFEAIMERCLARVTSSVDKREGSIIYDAIAPAAAELAIMYIELAYLVDRAFPDTATGEDLTKKCRERGVLRAAATYAIRKGYFEVADGTGCNVALGTRFSGGDINFAITAEIAPGQYQLTVETAGLVGNEYVGTLYPIDYVPDLAAARMEDILIPGEDEESDDALRARYFGSLESQAFGGNIADYKNKVEPLHQLLVGIQIHPIREGFKLAGGDIQILLPVVHRLVQFSRDILQIHHDRLTARLIPNKHRPHLHRLNLAFFISYHILTVLHRGKPKDSSQTAILSGCISAFLFLLAFVHLLHIRKK